jgi:von Willebrand factor type A domain
MHHHFRNSVALLAIVGAASASVPLAPTPALARQEAPQGFCRNAAALPDIGQERNWQAEQDRRDREAARAESSGGDRMVRSEVTTTLSVPAPPPSPAPPPPPADGGGGDYGDEGEIMVTGSRIASPSYDSPSPVTVVSSESIGESKAADASSERSPASSPGIVPPRPYPRPQPQSGLLTAGEHDDLLNPELYAAYVRGSNLAQTIRDLPRVDTLNVVTVKVADARGQAIPFAEVKVTCSDGNSVAMATQADGTATFFPGLDRLSERISVSARKDGRTIADARPVLVSNQPGGQTIGLTASAAEGRVDKLDLMFVIDTTGSMGDEIAYLQSELKTIINNVTAKHRGVDIRLGFVFYRDEGDDYVTYSVDFANDIGKQQGVLAKQSANGGGDYPEAMDQALVRAVSHQWRPDAVKSLFLVADAPPHNDKFGRTWAAAEAARAKRIHITPIAASGVAGEAEYAMRAMAAATQSRYLFLTDDSGIGNPHAPPAIDCYLVTRLDALVRRVIDSQLSGRRVEPDKDEVIRSVGNYDAGKCILPRGYKWDQG